MGLKKLKIEYILLLLLLIFGFFKTYSIHFDNRFPYHQDEWQHIALSKQAIEEGFNIQHNPYLDIKEIHPDLESGFHLFLSSAIILTGFDPVLYYQYLAAIFTMFSVLAIFYSISKLTENNYLGLISALVFISLKTNVNILGKDFFVPLTMAIPFIFLYAYYFLDSLQKKDIKRFSLAVFFLLVLLLIHPPSFIIVILPSIMELLLSVGSLELTKREKNKLILILLLFVLFGIIILWKGNIILTVTFFFQLLYFEPGWGEVEVKYFLPLLYGLANTFFAIIGLIKGYKTKMRFFVLLAFFSLAITSFFNSFGYTYFVPHPRAVYYSMLAMIPLTSFGLIWLFNYIKTSSFIKEKNLKRYLSYVLIFVFVILIFTSEYSLDEKYKTYSYPVIDEQAYSTLLWMRDNLPQDKVFVTHYFMTSSVYPVSGHKVMKLIPAILRSNNTEENLNFYTYVCDTKKKVLEKNEVDYVYSRHIIYCEFLQKVYDEEDIIYKVMI